MKQSENTKQSNEYTITLLKQRISLLSENDYVWREIASLTGLPKKLVKGIAKGKYIVEEQEGLRLIKLFDDLIAKLKINTQALYEREPISNQPDESYDQIKLDVKDIVIHKGTEDNQMLLLIRGTKL